MNKITCLDCKKFVVHTAKQRCRNCYLRYSYKKNSDGFLKRAKEYRKRNPEKIKEQVKIEHTKNREYYLQASRKWRKNNKEKDYRTKEIWRKANPDKVKAIRQRGDVKYRKNNIIKIKARNRTRWIRKSIGIPKGGNCLRCTKQTEKLEVHHISYEPNIGIYGFCKPCHHYIEKCIL